MTQSHRLFAGQFTDLDIRLIKVFRAVVECGGFSSAEVELGVAKSTISKKIKDLEIRTGVRLCERGRSGFMLTQEGRAIYDASTNLMISLEEFRSEINQFGSSVEGEFSIALIDAIATEQQLKIREMLKSLVKTYPQLNLNLAVASAREIDRAVQERQINVGVSVHRSGLANLSSYPLFKEENFLYCGKGHDLFERDDADLKKDDPAKYPLARHAYSQAETEAIHKWNLKPSAKCQQSEAVAILILTGHYIGFLPDHFAKYWVAAGDMRPIKPDIIKKRSRIDLICHKAAASNPILQSLLAML